MICEIVHCVLLARPQRTVLDSSEREAARNLSGGDVAELERKELCDPFQIVYQRFPHTVEEALEGQKKETQSRSKKTAGIDNADGGSGLRHTKNPSSLKFRRKLERSCPGLGRPTKFGGKYTPECSGSKAFLKGKAKDLFRRKQHSGGEVVGYRCDESFAVNVLNLSRDPPIWSVASLQIQLLIIVGEGFGELTLGAVLMDVERNSRK